MYTLNTVEQHGVAVCSATTGSYMASGEEVAQTLMARDYKDPQIINAPGYTVRRLTPTECARLQGFPDGWVKNLETENPTDADVDFWVDVFETHRRIVTHAKHPKTRKQVVKWLRQPHTDRAEYAMWGNGVALPCVYFVLRGVVEAGGNF